MMFLDEQNDNYLLYYIYLMVEQKNWQKVAYLRWNPSPSVKWKTIA